MNQAQQIVYQHLATSLFPAARLISAKRHRVVLQHQTQDGPSIYTKVFIRKSFPPVLGRLLVLCRARREYLVARRLQAIGLDVPMPLGWGRRKLADGRSIAYAQTLEVAPSKNLSTFLAALPAQEPLRLRLLQQYGSLLASLHSEGLLPGDYHLANILVTGSTDSPRLVLVDHESTRSYLAFAKQLRRRNLGLALCRSANPMLEATDDAAVLQGYQYTRPKDELLSKNLQADALLFARYRARDLIRKRRRHRLQRRKRAMFARVAALVRSS